MGSWGETLKVLPSSTLNHQQKLSICPRILGPRVKNAESLLGSNRSGPDRGDDRSNVILIPVRSMDAHLTRQERSSTFARIVTAALLER
jgi:hypothetical protein